MDPFPPVVFPLHGLTDDWGARRWLDFFDAWDGHPVGAVWLGQGEAFRPVPGRPWCLVGSLDRRHRLGPAGDDVDRSIAFEAAFRLVALTLPDGSDDDALTGRCIDRAERDADGIESWPVVSWTIDDQPVSARTWRWADCWVGVVPDLGGTAVAVLGHGFDPGEVQLRTLAGDDLSYGFDPAAELRWYDTIETSHSAAFRPEELERTPWPRHADHQP